MLASADPVEIDGIYYNLVNKIKQAEVTENPNKYAGEVVIPASVTYEGAEYSVTSIGAAAFYGCSRMTSITIPNSVTSIGNYAFSSCSSLISFTIPNSVTSIGIFAFYNCSGLTSITISNSVTNIDCSAFQGCTGLASVTIPNSVTSISYQVFDDCPSLTSIVVENGNSIYDSRNNCNAIIETSTNTLITGCKNTIIPNSVMSIGYGAFSECSSLTSITIPNSVTSIDDYAFYGCSGLISINIPNSVTNIGKYAFCNCSGLISITTPNSVTSIGCSAFSSCTDLTSVCIGSGVQLIYGNAFANCQELADVYCYAENVPAMRDYYNNNPCTSAFEGSIIEYATLYVPASAYEAYRTTEPWSQFGTIKTLEGDTPETKKCATPSISYGGKKLMFVCDTEGVEFVSEIKDADIKKFYDDRITLTATYEISVYATKAGYENSDVATATLVWSNASFTETTPATAIAPAAEMEAQVPILIQNNGGTLTIQGAQDGTPISVYTIAGIQAGTAVSQNSRATISTSMQQGDIAIIKIGEKSIKLLLK